MRKRVVRSATLHGYLRAACDVGIDGKALMARVGLSSDIAASPDSLIPLDAWIRLLDLSVAASARTDFGARVAIARGVPDYGLVSLLLREEETLGDALQTYSTQLHRHCDGIFIDLDERFEKPLLTFRIESEIPSIQVMEYCACGIVQMIRWLVGQDWQPDAVCQEHSRPAHTQLQGNFMRCELRYDQVVSGILLGRDALSMKVVASSAALRRHAKTLLEQTFNHSPENFEARVEWLMHQQLRDSRCSVDTLASSLGMNRRTLHRRLAGKGLSYSGLLQHVRCDTAKRLLSVQAVSLTQAAEALGFGSLSVFSRWFQASFGCSASTWKRNLAAAG
ncbi:AraC-like DNA-binding protein [Paraburkholderia sp. BL21I4N1]|nr:AraC-like DNA-binding protein [Paraburkholderia sp. BL21I4N1]